MVRYGEWRKPYRLTRRRLSSEWYRNFILPSTYSCELWRHRRGHYIVYVNGVRMRQEAVAFINFGTVHELPVRELFKQGSAP